MADAALEKKLMLAKFKDKLMRDRPEGFDLLDGAGFEQAQTKDQYSLVMRFVFTLDALESAAREAAASGIIAPDGYLYLAYPKKGNKRYRQFIDRDKIIERFDLLTGDGFISGTNLKMNKMVSLNEDFTLIGLRRFDKKPTRVNTSCVDDYVPFIPELRARIEHNEDLLKLYDALPKGYQKDWARHVFEAKTEQTREKRLAQMADILHAGYKSIALFRLGKK